MPKVGLGIITCNRPEFLLKCVESIQPCGILDTAIICNDGDQLTKEVKEKVFKSPVHCESWNTVNRGVGATKNNALSYLLRTGCDHMFLIEDDIIVKDPAVFNEYIRTAEKTGVEHLMFGYHGPANKVGGKPHPRLKVMYDGETGLALNQHCVGAFCYYSRRVLEKVGLNDEKFLNAFEHVEHTYRIWEARLTTPFWWFADIPNSYEYLDEQACSEVNSVIRPRPDWQSNIWEAAAYYKEKHGHGPVETPDHTPEQVTAFLKQLYGDKHKA